jgi:transcriptional regulator with XRE-family HTH domain
LIEPSLRLGGLLREAREARGLKQEEVAYAAGIGTSSYRALERGTAAGPSLYTVLSLFVFLGIDPAALRAVAGVTEEAAP